MRKKRRLRFTSLERFEDKVFYSPDGCHYWTHCVAGKGYGRIWFRGTYWVSSRMSYVLYKTEIPEGMHVLHVCDNALCVNPDHLFLGTNQENVKDKVAKGRQAFTRGERHGFTNLTNKDVLAIREYRNNGMSLSELSKIYGITVSSVCAIHKGRSWKHLPVNGTANISQKQLTEDVKNIIEQEERVTVTFY